jgi:hypothetical protein
VSQASKNERRFSSSSVIVFECVSLRCALVVNRNVSGVFADHFSNVVGAWSL